MARRGSTRWLGALTLAGLTGLGLSMLSAAPGQADPRPVADAAVGRVVVTDLRPSSTDRPAPAPDDLDAAIAVSTYPTVVDGVRGANLALRADGSVVGWGADLAGETRPPDDLTGVVDVDLAGGFAVAALSDGSVVAWGGDESGVLDVPADLTDATAVGALGSGGCGFGIALRSDGTVAQWGGAACEDASAYELPTGLTDVTAISAGSDAGIALRSDGTVVTWGPSGDLGFLDGPAPSSWADVVQVSTQSRTFVGLTADHRTVAYGIWGEAGAPVGITDVDSVSAGATPAFLRTDGSAYLWQASSAALPPPPYSALVGGLGYVVTIVPVDPEPTESAEPTPTSEPTATGEPTATPEPTDTAGPTEPSSAPTQPGCSPGAHHPRKGQRGHRPQPAATSQPSATSTAAEPTTQAAPTT